MNRQIDCRVEEYLTLDRSAKSVLAMQIATKILKDKEGGRFLERVQNVGWKIVQDKTIIRNKITQAFRARSRSVSFGETDEVEHEREREVDGHQKTFNEKNRNNEEETESDSKKARLET